MKKKSQTPTSVKSGQGKKKESTKMPAIAESPTIYAEESNHPSHLRRGAVSIGEVRELADFLISQAQILNGIAKNMERLAMNSCDRVDGVTKGIRGKKLVAEFAANLNRACTDQQFG